MAETTTHSTLLALRNNTEQKSFVMVRVPAQQPEITSRIKCFVWNWLRKYAQVHEGNDVDSPSPASTIVYRGKMNFESEAETDGIHRQVQSQSGDGGGQGDKDLARVGIGLSGKRLKKNL